MDEPIGVVAQRKAQRRKRVVLCFVSLFVIGAIAYFVLNSDPTQSKGAIGIVRGTGAELETVFVGPTELQAKWDNVEGHAWSDSSVEGRIRNISNKTVRFQDIIYRVKNENGVVIWEEHDARFPDGGKLEPLQYFNFFQKPICKRESKTFEVVVENATVVNR